MLVDLSSIAHPIWHTNQADPDPDGTATKIVARVRALAGQHPMAAICCDAGRSFRKDLDPQYKANRPQAEAPLHHQIDLAKDQLRADGFPVWAAKGFEADDVIASATAAALAMPDLDVLIVSADKDLLQLVGPRVRAMSSTDGSIRDTEAVVAKFGVRPDQMRDFLTLVGDASDNIKGAQGIGPKRAAELLGKFGTLEAIYEVLGPDPTKTMLPPAIAKSLSDFSPHMADVRALITLRADVEIPFEEIAAERVPKEAESFGMEEQMPAVETPAEAPAPVVAPSPEPVNGNGNGHAPVTALAVHEPDVLAPTPVEWERQLEPRSIREAIEMSKHMFQSRLFSAYGTPQGVLATILAGRELGMQAMASLRGFDIIDGRPTFKADLIRALVLKSGKAKFFRCTARSAAAATFATQRGDDPPIDLTYTIEEGKQAWGKTEDGWAKSGWGKNPADMLVARAGAKLARLVYPDIVHGLYSPEEFD